MVLRGGGGDLKDLEGGGDRGVAKRLIEVGVAREGGRVVMKMIRLVWKRVVRRKKRIKTSI